MQSNNKFGMIFSFLSQQTILFNLRYVPGFQVENLVVFPDQAVNEFRLIQNNNKASLFPTYTDISRNLRLNEVFPDHISRLPAFPDFGTWYFPLQPDKRFSDFSLVLKTFYQPNFLDFWSPFLLLHLPQIILQAPSRGQFPYEKVGRDACRLTWGKGRDTNQCSNDWAAF